MNFIVIVELNFLNIVSHLGIMEFNWNFGFLELLFLCLWFIFPFYLVVFAILLISYIIIKIRKKKKKINNICIEKTLKKIIKLMLVFLVLWILILLILNII